MSLRVTQGMMHLQLNRNLNRNITQMSEIQEQTTTGRKINKPSDDPVGMTYSIRYRAELAGNLQYQKNVDAAMSWLEFNDTVVDQAGNVLHKIKELTTQAATGTNPQIALDSIKNEIEQLKNQLMDIGNSKLNGKYVFNGEQFDKMPYDATTPGFDAKSVATDSGSIEYAVGVNAKLDINFTGDQLFGAADPTGTGKNIFSVLDRLMTSLSSGNQSGIKAEISNIDAGMDRMLNVRSEIGARVNRVELMQNRLADLEINLTDMKSKTEDADYEKLLISSQINENIYQASLAVGSKVIKQSLVDYLR
ncbi:flagellar hook-associated protein FlgL [Paenibacillus sp. L3-i20]|uniref:flagellar hook-associated protein FlgL n=1 Tax=Paenibacillus sp. L3-i20 TaxID=2905833 RepID=UPI001EE0B5FF|nr:flagellar hook-associated protein FlgL [Paenibacillus sp. L3-i20]GKU76824.1 flagellar hook-associated protein FlgL [Paenibacillus sp. L3-i20]